eukprot:IDg18039t1
MKLTLTLAAGIGAVLVASSPISERQYTDLGYSSTHLYSGSGDYIPHRKPTYHSKPFEKRHPKTKSGMPTRTSGNRGNGYLLDESMGTPAALSAGSALPMSPSMSLEPAPESSVQRMNGTRSATTGNITVSVAAERISSVVTGNTHEDGIVAAAVQPGFSILTALNINTRQLSSIEHQQSPVHYTDTNGVQYYQDSNTGQWYYYPSPTPAPSLSPSPSPSHVPPPSGSSISLKGGLNGSASGDNSVTVGATGDQSAAAVNGLIGAIAAAIASPGATNAIGFAF